MLSSLLGKGHFQFISPSSLSSSPFSFIVIWYPLSYYLSLIVDYSCHLYTCLTHFICHFFVSLHFFLPINYIRRILLPVLFCETKHRMLFFVSVQVWDSYVRVGKMYRTLFPSERHVVLFSFYLKYRLNINKILIAQP